MRYVILGFIMTLATTLAVGQDAKKYDFVQISGIANKSGDVVFTWPQELDSLEAKYKKRFKTIPDALGHLTEKGWEIVSANGSIGASIIPVYFVLMRRERKK